jgi:hypothetical protein
MNAERRPFIRFETMPIEDRTASASGVMSYRDRDMIIITPYGSEGKSELVEFYEDWVTKIERQLGPVRAPGGDTSTPFMVEARFPREWLDEVKKAYAAWKKGEELPTEGTPLKQWGVLPPAMLKNFIAHHIFTIEQLAAASDEALNPVGMGARIHRNQAQDWLKINKEDERNKLVAKQAQLEVDNAQLKTQIASMQDQLAALLARIPAVEPQRTVEQHVGTMPRESTLHVPDKKKAA